MSTENLTKSIDALIDSVFIEDSLDDVEKSINIVGDASTKADAVVKQAPKGQNDASRGAGRPKQIADVPNVDQDGARARDYDSAISEKNKEKDQEEADQIKEMNQVKTSGRAYFKKANGEDVTEEDWSAFEAFEKAQADAELEEFQKAEDEKQETLIKSIVEKTVNRVRESYESKIESLQKSLNESTEMVKAIANTPVRSKSITNLEALEKGVNMEGQSTQETFTKSEMLDAAEELSKAGKLEDTHVIELDNNGYIYDTNARAVLENYLQTK